MENWLKFEHIELFDGSVQKLKSFIEIVDLFHEIYKTKNINEKHFLTVIKYCKKLILGTNLNLFCKIDLNQV